MKRKILRKMLIGGLVAASAGALAGCSKNKQVTTNLNYVVDFQVQEDGGIYSIYANGDKMWLGTIDQIKGNPGDDGKNGISISSVKVNNDGELIVILSDGSEINAGRVMDSKKTYLNKSAEFDTKFKSEDGGVAEIVKYNRKNSKIYLVNGKTKTLDIVSLKIDEKNELKKELVTVFDENTDRIDFTKILSDNLDKFKEDFVVGDITSVSINEEKEFIAVALQHQDYTKNGCVVLLDFDGNFISIAQCGIQPDMVKCYNNLILTADEGEPRGGYEFDDPKGSVTIIDITNINAPTSKIVDFTAFDSKRDELVANNVLIKKNTLPSVDFEPEYITIQGNKAYVALQEANAIATLDLTKKEFESVKALGFKNHNLAGNEIDVVDDGMIKIKNQDIYGVYMPDGIDSFVYNGEVYIATANEGDAREWGDYSGVSKYVIEGTKVEVLDNNQWDGLDDSKHYILGGRSFSIFKASDMSLVYDSGSLIEETIAKSEYSNYFNASNNNITLDSRSKKKGPEPETVLVREINGSLYSFVGLERIGGIMTFNISNFLDNNVKVDSYTSTRDYSDKMLGDVAPEGLDFINSADSINGKDILIVANENSGTVSFYNVESEKKEYNYDAKYIEKIQENPDHLVISAVYGSGGKLDGAVSCNFIQITNPTENDIDLTGYKLKYAESAATNNNFMDYELSGIIEAGKSMLIAGANANTISASLNITNYDLKFEDLVISNKKYTVQLADSTAVVDSVGVDEADVSDEIYETNPVLGLSKNKVIIRKNNVDSNNNVLDFEVVDFKGLAVDDELVLHYLNLLEQN